jgi:nucleolin
LYTLTYQHRFLLRRTALRAISATPSKTYLAKPRSITTLTPSAFQLKQQQWSISSFQRRFASDEAAKTEDDFAQTAAEAPIEENLTPAQQDAQAEPTDASHTVGADALEAAVKTAEHSPRDRKPRAPREARNNVPNNMLYIGNLYYEVTADQLKRVFSRFGEIESVKIVYDNRGMSRG